jgi:hypothetical protein
MGLTIVVAAVLILVAEVLLARDATVPTRQPPTAYGAVDQPPTGARERQARASALREPWREARWREVQEALGRYRMLFRDLLDPHEVIRPERRR